MRDIGQVSRQNSSRSRPAGLKPGKGSVDLAGRTEFHRCPLSCLPRSTSPTYHFIQPWLAAEVVGSNLPGNPLTKSSNKILAADLLNPLIFGNFSDCISLYHTTIALYINIETETMMRDTQSTHGLTPSKGIPLTRRLNMKPLVPLLACLLAILVCSSSLLFAAEAAAPAALSPVVSTAWLREHLEDPDLITLHIGPPGSYEEGHIPSARSASLRRVIRVNEDGIRDEMLPAEDIAEALAELGIGNSSRIVIYFANESAAWAVARYLLTLEYIGMTGRVAYLDGGLPKWVAENNPVSKDLPAFEVADLAVETVSDVLVDTEWLRERLEEPGMVIIDGRPADGYAGLAGHWDRLGHIPGAKNIPFFTLLAEEPPYVLKSREELLDMFRAAGAKAGDIVVVYCGTGLWASLPYLAARYLDYEARLYDGSFQEWSANENLPVEGSGKRDHSSG